jgi:hypothetical protein
MELSSGDICNAPNRRLCFGRRKKAFAFRRSSIGNIPVENICDGDRGDVNADSKSFPSSENGAAT